LEEIIPREQAINKLYEGDPDFDPEEGEEDEECTEEEVGTREIAIDAGKRREEGGGGRRREKGGRRVEGGRR
jgi:hypothetical protein